MTCDDSLGETNVVFEGLHVVPGPRALAICVVVPLPIIARRLRVVVPTAMGARIDVMFLLTFGTLVLTVGGARKTAVGLPLFEDDNTIVGRGPLAAMTESPSEERKKKHYTLMHPVFM